MEGRVPMWFEKYRNESDDEMDTVPSRRRSNMAEAKSKEGTNPTNSYIFYDIVRCEISRRAYFGSGLIHRKVPDIVLTDNVIIVW